jgi:two-component system response regulator (stage 0 sporulation protein F)
MATLLVVDDEQDIRDLVVQRMMRDGHEVLSADSGSSALDLIRECGLPDAAILDVDMPGMDGFDVLRELRLLRPDLPVMLLTVLWGSRLQSRVREAGVSCLGKPFTAAQLAAGVRTLLDADGDP